VGGMTDTRLYLDIFAGETPEVTLNADYLRISWDTTRIYLTPLSAIGMIREISLALEKS
jgi:hypothetical protein